MHKPTNDHLSVVKRILCYLCQSIHHGLLLRHSTSKDLQPFSDSDWVGCPDGKRSTIGYCIFFGSNIISWSSHKQKTMSRSSTKVEIELLPIQKKKSSGFSHHYLSSTSLSPSHLWFGAITLVPCILWQIHYSTHAPNKSL